ncbi:NAD-dependent epimerase/dehydratase family protein [Streptomyces sp. NPDC087212]|uniref:NAD-dependent epimerase/dehydratase family protein n=1 Tax=Streptomyces sp. NPDC087212 TaxID=3365766 RepID=UPI0038275D45
MRILVLGGTWFLGKSVAEEALRRGWDVTAFDRGRSGQDMPGVRSVRGDRTRGADLDRLSDHGPRDAVIDTSTSELTPREARWAAQALRDAASRRVHVSTVSVYAGCPHQTLTERPRHWSARRTRPRRSGTRVRTLHRPGTDARRPVGSGNICGRWATGAASATRPSRPGSGTRTAPDAPSTRPVPAPVHRATARPSASHRDPHRTLRPAHPRPPARRRRPQGAAEPNRQSTGVRHAPHQSTAR